MKVNTGRFKKGQAPWNKGKTYPQLLGEKHFAWKGDQVGYYSLHSWIARRLGKASFCGFEDVTCKGMFEWANLSGEYKRDLNDYISLCRSHHRRLDLRRNKN